MKVNCLTYESCRKRHPELKLPAWQQLHPLDRRRAKHMTVEQLRVRRFNVLLIRQPGKVDRIKLSDYSRTSGGSPVFGHKPQLF